MEDILARQGPQWGPPIRVLQHPHTVEKPLATHSKRQIRLACLYPLQQENARKRVPSTTSKPEDRFTATACI